MSIKAHIVLEFGKNRIELYRHWGGDVEITGFDLLQKIIDAPECKERGHFHDGGYVLRLMLEDSDGSLPQYQVIDGLIGQDCSHGYHLEFTERDSPSGTTTIDMGDGPIVFENTEEVSVVASCDGDWTIRYAELKGWECFEDWKDDSTEYTVESFAEFVRKATDVAVSTGKISDLDLRTAFLSQFKRNDS